MNRHDLEACGDVAAWLAEQSDSLSAEQAVEMLSEARKVHRAFALAIDMLETQALQLIEQPILVGHTAWAKKPVLKKRPRQGQIAATVEAMAARPDENGEFPPAFEVASKAVTLMAALYVSPSTLPKVGGVKALGLEMTDVVDEEHTGFELKATELD
jgi:hypothetical protein